MAAFDRTKLRVQGEGRPISTGTVTQVATLKHRNVVPLVAPLKLELEQELALTSQIREIMAEYLGPILLAQKLADHATALRLLAQIASGSGKLAEQLTQLDSAMLRAIEDQRAEPWDEAQPPLFDTLSLVHKLARLSHAAERTRELVRAHPTGAPKKIWLDQAVAKLLEVLEAAGLPVIVLNSGSVEPRRQLRGRGGELLLAVFYTFDCHVGEPELWGAINRVRRQSKINPARCQTVKEPQDT